MPPTGAIGSTSSRDVSGLDPRKAGNVETNRSMAGNPIIKRVPGGFRERNLGLKGEPPPDFNVERGYYLDILV